MRAKELLSHDAGSIFTSVVPVAASMSYHRSPIAIRERLATNMAGTDSVIPTFDLQDVVVLSTCNRFEIYAVSASANQGMEHLRGIMQAFWDAEADDALEPYMDFHVGSDVAHHLFRVAAGLDSLVIGESEILGQVGAALGTASASGEMRQEMIRLFHHAIRVGRRARSDTSIGRQAGSVSSVAIRLARETLGDLDGKRVLVIGAGEAAALAARALMGAGANDISVANRTLERASILASEVGGRTIPWDSLQGALNHADVVITATGASDYVLGADDIHQAIGGRDNETRLMLILDIAVPRDVDPRADDIPGVRLFNVDDLYSLRDVGLAHRQQAVTKVESIIAEEMNRFHAWWQNIQVAPTIRSLHGQAEQIRDQEVTKALRKLPGLTPDERDVVEALTKSLVAKLLHNPTASLKDGLGDPEHVEATRRLFQLPVENDSHDVD